MTSASTVPKLYYGVIEEVIANVRDAFIDEGVDEQTLAELKMIWEKKVAESKVIEREPDPLTGPKTLPNTLPATPALQQTLIQQHQQFQQQQAQQQQQQAQQQQQQQHQQQVQQQQQAQHQQQQQAQQTRVATTIPQQIAMPANLAVPQAVLQYSTSASADGQKTMALNLPQKLTLTVPANLAQSGLQTLVSAPGTAVQIPADLASILQGGQQLSSLPFHTVTIPVSAPQQQQQTTGLLGQMDGADDTSDDDDEDDFPDNDDDADENDDDQNEEDAGDEEEEEDPLNSDDDVSDDDPSDLFDTDNVVVCQYDKITRSKNRWKFHLKDGIMNLQGKDFVFQKALGDSEW